MKIECEIITPQFNGKVIREMFKQYGVFDTHTLLFTSNGSFGGHNVQFSSILDFCKAVVDKTAIDKIDTKYFTNLML